MTLWARAQPSSQSEFPALYLCKICSSLEHAYLVGWSSIQHERVPGDLNLWYTPVCRTDQGSPLSRAFLSTWWRL